MPMLNYFYQMERVFDMYTYKRREFLGFVEFKGRPKCRWCVCVGTKLAREFYIFITFDASDCDCGPRNDSDYTGA